MQTLSPLPPPPPPFGGVEGDGLRVWVTVTVITTVDVVAEHCAGGVVVLGGGVVLGGVVLGSVVGGQLGNVLLVLEDGGAGGTVPNEGFG